MPPKPPKPTWRPHTDQTRLDASNNERYNEPAHSGLISLIKRVGLPVRLRFANDGYGFARIETIPDEGFVHLAAPACVTPSYQAGCEYQITLTTKFNLLKYVLHPFFDKSRQELVNQTLKRIADKLSHEPVTLLNVEGIYKDTSVANIRDDFFGDLSDIVEDMEMLRTLAGGHGPNKDGVKRLTLSL